MACCLIEAKPLWPEPMMIIINLVLCFYSNFIEVLKVPFDNETVLVQIKAWCCQVTSHYLKWTSDDWGRNFSEIWNYTNFHQQRCGNVVRKMAAMLFQPQCFMLSFAGCPPSLSRAGKVNITPNKGGIINIHVEHQTSATTPEGLTTVLWSLTTAKVL